MKEIDVKQGCNLPKGELESIIIERKRIIELSKSRAIERQLKLTKSKK